MSTNTQTRAAANLKRCGLKVNNKENVPRAGENQAKKSDEELVRGAQEESGFDIKRVVDQNLHAQHKIKMDYHQARQEVSGKVTPPPSSTSPLDDHMMMSGGAQKQQSSTYSSSSRSKGGSPTTPETTTMFTTPSLTMSALLGKRGFTQAGGHFQVNPFNLAQQHGFRTPQRTGFLEQALQNLATGGCGMPQMIHTEKMSVPGSFPIVPTTPQIMNVCGGGVSALTSQLLEQVKLRQGPNLSQTIEEMKLSHSQNIFKPISISPSQTQNESLANGKPFSEPIETNKHTQPQFIVPPYDPTLDYMTLFVKKYAQNQQLISTFSDILSQRNCLLAEVLNEEHLANLEQIKDQQALANLNLQAFERRATILPSAQFDQILPVDPKIIQSDILKAPQITERAMSETNHQILGAAPQRTQIQVGGGGVLTNTMDGDEEPSNVSSLNRWYSSGRKRHFRRCNNEIQKTFECPYQTCGKTYGSEGSLNLHMKTKHAAGSKTDREKFAREVILAVRAGHEISDEQLERMRTLPPGLIEQSASELSFLSDFLLHPSFKQARKRLEPFLISGGQKPEEVHAFLVKFAPALARSPNSSGGLMNDADTNRISTPTAFAAGNLIHQSSSLTSVTA